MKTEPKQAKHTAGSWEIGAEDGIGYTQIKRKPYTGDGAVMALAAPQNARLIAAAPDMEKEIEVLKKQKADLLEAAKFLRDLVRSVASVPKPPSQEWDQWNEALAAIAKAEGREGH